MSQWQTSELEYLCSGESSKTRKKALKEVCKKGQKHGWENVLLHEHIYRNGEIIAKESDWVEVP